MAKFYYTDTKNEIKVGDTIYVVRNAERTVTKPGSSMGYRENYDVVKQYQVDRVGNKFVYISMGRWMQDKICPDVSYVYQTEEVAQDTINCDLLRIKLKNAFDYGSPKLTNDQVKAIATILNISI